MWEVKVENAGIKTSVPLVSNGVQGIIYEPGVSEQEV
jgi:hypothetical protein